MDAVTSGQDEASGDEPLRQAGEMGTGDPDAREEDDEKSEMPAENYGEWTGVFRGDYGGKAIGSELAAKIRAV